MELFHISEGYPDWIDEHWNKRELGLKHRSSNVICKPYDNICISPNPYDTNEKSKWIIVIIDLTQRTRDCKVLSMGQRHQGKVLEDVLSIEILSSRARNVESFLVDSLIHKFIDDGLRNGLRLTHHFLLKKDLLPIKLVYVIIVNIKHIIVLIWVLLFFVYFRCLRSLSLNYDTTLSVVV